ncbi:hypothetical protein SAMN05444673_4768 [Bacillus sp. OV166]|jgi:hypothetical protein|nr:hypothetical protein COE25_05625 [Bacillus sp. AFS031507]SMQ82278.1 hypothetical protein SAMN05444673_4768 [Bacillus sp. OV166]
MRFLYKRPRMEHIQEELNTVMEVMVSDVFIYLDLFVFSLIFTMLLSSTLHSLAMSILFFFGCYSLFSCVYLFVFNRKVK